MLKADENLRENTWLYDRYLPMNVFCNHCSREEIMYVHWHRYIEIIYMQQGTAAFNIGGTIINASPGDIIFVNSGMLHSGVSTCNEEVTYYAIVFDQALLSDLTPDPGHAKYIAPFLENKRQFPLSIPKSHEKHKAFEELILKTADEFMARQEGYEAMIRTYLTQLTITVLRYFFPGGNNLSDIHYRNSESIKRLISHIEEHYYEKYTTDRAARLVNLSPYYFCRIFKKITGRTLTEFLNLCRINKAEELLKSTELPVTAIAEKVGFCNVNYFDRVFKQLRRYSPSDCRKFKE